MDSSFVNSHSTDGHNAAHYIVSDPGGRNVSPEGFVVQVHGKDTGVDVQFLLRWKWAMIGVGAIVVVAGFLAFRPDKLFVDDVVNESLSDAFVTESSAAPPTTTTTVAPPSDSTPPLESTTTTALAPTTTQPSGPVGISTGAFFGIDHSASGTAAVYEQDGAYALRFEDDTDIQNGPDLFIWLLADDDYSGGEPSEYIDLGKIKGNVGGQNYDLPAEFEPDIHRFVLVWCLRFSVPFAAAPLV